MNLIKTQEQLNILPPTPQSLQYLTSAAKGMNPNVPPYLALMRMNEIKRQLQEDQTPKNPPTEPLNAALPKEIAQHMLANTIGGPPQQPGQPGQPQQPPQMAQGIAQGMPQMAPQGAPQMAPQEAPPVSAADGGLMNAPIGADMFQYGSGGIVAFGDGGDVSEEDDTADEGDDDTGGEDTGAIGAEGSGIDVPSEYANLKAQIAAQQGKRLPTVQSRQDIQAALTKGKDYGVTNEPTGAEYLKGLTTQQTARGEESDKQRAENARLKKLAFYNSLIAAGEATRGQSGIGGLFGGFGAAWNKEAAEDIAREQGLRGDALKEAAMINEATHKVQELRRAQLNGDVAAAQKAQVELAKIAKDNNVSLNTLLGKMATGILGVAGRKESAKGMAEAARIRNQRPVAPRNPPKPGELETAMGIIKSGSPEDKAALKEYYGLKQAPALAGIAQKVSTEEDKHIDKWKITNRGARALDRSKDPADKAKLDKLEEQERATFRKNKPLATGIATPPPPPPPPGNATAAPAAALPPEIAKTLKENVHTTFANEQTWTLKNGKPVRVK